MSKKGFTLIELLIVVAIIAILAAIAVPNFMEAQVRSKVSRVKSDQRTYATALECYRVDNNKFPRHALSSQWAASLALISLSTPVAYITTSNLSDPFFSCGRSAGWGVPLNDDYIYQDYSLSGKNLTQGDYLASTYLNYMGGTYEGYNVTGIASNGPSTKVPSWAFTQYVRKPRDMQAVFDTVYDPSNGTVSMGMIQRYVGDTRGLSL